MHEFEKLIESFVVGWLGGLETSGYLGIFVLMAIESSFIPFPSEIVMIPAGALAAQGKLTVWGSILAGTAGSLAGGLFNYFVALFLGRAFLLRWGKYFFVSQEGLLWAEKHWEKHGELTTFVCRLFPAIRQLISLPAGVARMNLARFCLWTTLGAGLWVTILTVTGYVLADRAEILWAQHKTQVTLGLFALGGLLLVAYIAKHFLFKRRVAAQPTKVENYATSDVAARV